MTGRMYQDTHFNLSILNGLSIEQLKVCVNPDNGGVLIVYLKAEGQPIFHFFLDVGIASSSFPILPSAWSISPP